MVQALTVYILEAVAAAVAVFDRGGPSCLQAADAETNTRYLLAQLAAEIEHHNCKAGGRDGGGEEGASANAVEAESAKAAGTAGTITAGPKGSASVHQGGSGGVAQEPSLPASLQGLLLKVSAVLQLLLALCLPLSWLLLGVSHLEAPQTGYSITKPASAAASASGATPPPTGGPAPLSGDGASAPPPDPPQ